MSQLSSQSIETNRKDLNLLKIW